MAQESLARATRNKNDEFYTLYEDIEKELVHYIDYLKDKVVYCNCDDYRMSNFWKYFMNNFTKYQLKGLVATGYNKDGRGIMATYYGEEVYSTELEGDGDFQSEECINILKKCDIVITNPPFSKIRYLIPLLFEHQKDFILLGNCLCVGDKDIFPYIFHNKLFLGSSKQNVYSFMTDSGEIKKIQGIVWLQTLKFFDKRLELTESYSPEKYPRYDNYDAIEVGRTKLIPKDYNGKMGVPVTFLDYYNPEQFELIGVLNDFGYGSYNPADGILIGTPTKVKNKNKHKGPVLNGRCVMQRLIIRKR